MHQRPSDSSKPIVITQPISTGPRTESGKQISSRNATKHGCCSLETLILPTEDIEDFKALEATWTESYKPRDKAEAHLLTQLVQADWILQRATRTAIEIESQLLAEVSDPLQWDDRHHRTLARFLRYQTTHTNNVAKRRKALEEYRKNRDAEAARGLTTSHKEERLALAKDKLAFYKAQNKRETWDEHLERMRQKAIALGYRTPDE